MAADLKNFQLLKQGSEARIYVGTFLGQKAIAKERFSKKYRHPFLDQKLTKERLRAEIRSMLRCKVQGIRTPTIYHVDQDHGLLFMEYLETSPTCRDHIQTLLEHKDSGAAKKRLLSLSREIGRVLCNLHLNNLIHGDLTTSNILLVSEKVGAGCDGSVELCLIDFGLAFAEGTAEDKGVDLYVLERALLSTHPNTEFMFEAIVDSYKETMAKKAGRKGCQEVIKKFEEIRMRGRKRTMVG